MINSLLDFMYQLEQEHLPFCLSEHLNKCWTGGTKQYQQ